MGCTSMELNNAQKAEVNQLDSTIAALIATIIAIGISIINLLGRKKSIIDEKPLPSCFDELPTLTSIIIVLVSFFFFGLARDECKESEEEDCSAQISLLTSFLVLFVSIVRLINISGQTPGSEAQTVADSGKR